MDLILRLAEERGTTVLLITHDRALATGVHGGNHAGWPAFIYLR